VRSQTPADAVTVGVIGDYENVSLGLLLGLLLSLGAAGHKQSRNSGGRSHDTHGTPNATTD
jgi:hypothetical protein